MIELHRMGREDVAWAQKTVTESHYLHKPIDTRCSIEGYTVDLPGFARAGLLLFGRPQATKCKDWYGDVEDVRDGRCEVTRWQVLNLARVWISSRFQPGGECYDYSRIPGFFDRKGAFRSTLASEILKTAVRSIGFDYLMCRPPCFLDEPYQIEWLLSYCDTRKHRGTIYQAAGFELYHTKDSIQTWRVRLPNLTPDQHFQVQRASAINPRSNWYRSQRAQLSLWV